MFVILENKTICLTRGDIADIVVSATLQDGTLYTFQPGDVVRFSVFKRGDCGSVVIRKDVVAESETETVTISLTSADTCIGNIINMPVDYWYEIEVNPDTAPQTIVCYDENGAKIFRLYPEGGDLK